MGQAKDVIEDLLSRRNRSGRRPGGFGGVPGGGGGRSLAIAAVAALAVWGVFSSFYTVQPEERAVVKRFGRVIGVSDPGLHFKVPFGVDAVQKVATERVLKQEFGFRSEDVMEAGRTRFAGADFPDESLMLSGDLNIIDVEWVVQYRIADPIKYLYSMRDPALTLRDLSESVMRRVVGNTLGAEVLTVGRVEISATVRDEVQEAMDRYDNGIQVITVELQDVIPPERVQPAFNEVNEARQERERMINDAMRQMNDEIPRAQGTANRVIAEAEGYAIERVNRALGETARFSAVLEEYRSVPEVTRARLYLERLNETLPNVGSVLVIQEGQVSPLPLLNVGNGPQQAVRAAPPETTAQAQQAPPPQPQRQSQSGARSR